MTWEYIAGFFDGEGTISRNTSGFRISMPQTNQEVLEKIRHFSGLGNICKVTKRKSHWKDSWTYYITKQKNVLIFLKGISPHLVLKKDLADNTIPELKLIVNKQKLKILKHENRRKKALILRSKGLAYWRIGEKMGGLDRGYVRKLILGVK